RSRTPRRADHRGRCRTGAGTSHAYCTSMLPVEQEISTWSSNRVTRRYSSSSKSSRVRSAIVAHPLTVRAGSGVDVEGQDLACELSNPLLDVGGGHAPHSLRSDDGVVHCVASPHSETSLSATESSDTRLIDKFLF